MPDINNMRNKEDYVNALSQERFTEYVAQRAADRLLGRRLLAVLIASTFMCAIAALALSYNG